MREIRTTGTMFFKHKYLTMPTITLAQVVLKAATDLEEAIRGVIPQHNGTTEALTKLREIFTLTADGVKKQSASRENQE